MLDIENARRNTTRVPASMPSRAAAVRGTANKARDLDAVPAAIREEHFLQLCGAASNPEFVACSPCSWKHFSAHVTGVCGPSNVDLVKSLGADKVIDYTTRDFADGDARYDVICDLLGKEASRAACACSSPAAGICWWASPRPYLRSRPRCAGGLGARARRGS